MIVGVSENEVRGDVIFFIHIHFCDKKFFNSGSTWTFGGICVRNEIGFKDLLLAGNLSCVSGSWAKCPIYVFFLNSILDLLKFWWEATASNSFDAGRDVLWVAFVEIVYLNNEAMDIFDFEVVVVHVCYLSNYQCWYYFLELQMKKTVAMFATRTWRRKIVSQKVLHTLGSIRGIVMCWFFCWGSALNRFDRWSFLFNGCTGCLFCASGGLFGWFLEKRRFNETTTPRIWLIYHTKWRTNFENALNSLDLLINANSSIYFHIL